MKISANLVLISILSFTAGCGVFSDRESRVVEPESEDEIMADDLTDRVAMNLVYALSQLYEVQPRQTTVQFSEPETALGRIIEKRLRDVGYGIQRVTSDIGSNYVRYQYQNSITESGPITRYTLSIGPVKAERNYIRKNDAIYPDSELLISGADEMVAKNNDSIFEGTGEIHQYASDIIFESSNTPEVVMLDGSGNSSQNADLNFAATVRRNIHDNNELSNYTAVFEDYVDVENVVLIFANDRLSIGVNNKKVLQRIATVHNPDTDIFSVVGCSHGKTRLPGGNVVLATGRTNRVKEELIFSGIPHDQIFDEGCWGKVVHKDFPARGVVIILKRRKS